MMACRSRWHLKDRGIARAQAIISLQLEQQRCVESCGLRRASDFIVALLHRLHDDAEVSLSTAASDAYYKTLYNNHTWYTSAAFVVVLKVRTAAPKHFSLCPE